MWTQDALFDTIIQNDQERKSNDTLSNNCQA
jgi:hypothetical protein